MRPAWTVAGTLGLLLVLALSLAGCGSAARPSVATSPAAEPGHDARLTGSPAGVSVRVGPDPQGIAVASGLGVVAVGVHNPSRIVLLRASDGAILRRVAIAAAPRHLALVSDTGPLLVPEEGANRLLEMLLPGGAGRSFITGSFPHAAAVVGPYLFAADERGAGLTEVLPGGGERFIGGFRQPGGTVGVDGELAVVDVADFTLSLVDVSNGRLLARLPAGAGPTHDAASRGHVYVLDTRGGAVLTFSAHPFRQVGRLAIGGSPYGVALDPVHQRLWVTLTGRNEVAELALGGDGLPRLVRTFDTGLQPDTVAVDNATGEVYVANQISGTVQRFMP